MQMSLHQSVGGVTPPISTQAFFRFEDRHQNSTKSVEQGILKHINFATGTPVTVVIKTPQIFY
jgi:hypothetical protein